uniref:ABC transporter permease subunit n=1 Tax=Faecalibacterium prausnitzii TaxID=853 RepID=UPI004025B7D1
MNKKKLSRSGSLQSSVTSVLAALLCILIGLLVGFLVLVAINPAHAWGDGFVRIIKGGFHDAPYGVGKELANAAPLIMTGLSVAFAFKTGLFNIGAAGQYTLGAYGALYCAIMLKLPWFVCLLAAAMPAMGEGAPSFDTWMEAADYLRDCTQERAGEIRFTLSVQEALTMPEDDLRQEFLQMAP